MWEDFLINTAISTILLAIKNPKKTKKWKSALVKIAKAVMLAFPDEFETEE